MIQPIILLTFSNNMDDYLPNIVAEQKAIKQQLLGFDDKNYLQIRDLQHATTEEIFYHINRYHNQVAIWHYGGHADGNSIQLETEIGVVQSANVKGIAGLLGTQKHLKLVFLNGCATQGQVKSLLKNGVKAVIATRVPISDNKAVKFAKQFYEAMANGSSIREAFTKSKAFIEASSATPIKDIESTRGFVFDYDDNKEEKIAWGLYWQPESEAVLDWKLPTQFAYDINFSSDKFHQSKSEINSTLVDTTVKALKSGEVVLQLVDKIKELRRRGDKKRKPTDAEKKDAIVRSFLAPISVHIRALFTETYSQQYDENRLKQLVITYRETMKLMAFTLLSDLWDKAHQRQLAAQNALQLSDNQRLQIEAFFNLNEHTHSSFDYFQLVNALLQIGNQNKVEFYIDAFEKYKNGWATNEKLNTAHEHFQLMQTVLDDDVSSRLIQPYCIATEYELTNVLCELNYLVHYKMAVVKNIEVQQIKNLPPASFKHIIVELDNNYNDVGEKDRSQELDKPTDMESVLIYKNIISDNLNLSPFVLDENALIREYNSKVYFFSHLSDKGLHFYWIENESDTIIINDDNYAYIQSQFYRAKHEILDDLAVVENELSTIEEEDEDDIW